MFVTLNSSLWFVYFKFVCITFIAIGSCSRVGRSPSVAQPHTDMPSSYSLPYCSVLKQSIRDVMCCKNAETSFFCSLKNCLLGVPVVDGLAHTVICLVVCVLDLHDSPTSFLFRFTIICVCIRFPFMTIFWNVIYNKSSGVRIMFASIS